MLFKHFEFFCNRCRSCCKRSIWVESGHTTYSIMTFSLRSYFKTLICCGVIWSRVLLTENDRIYCIDWHIIYLSWVTNWRSLRVLAESRLMLWCRVWIKFRLWILKHLAISLLDRRKLKVRLKWSRIRGLSCRRLMLRWYPCWSNLRSLSGRLWRCLFVQNLRVL